MSRDLRCLGLKTGSENSALKNYVKLSNDIINESCLYLK